MHAKKPLFLMALIGLFLCVSSASGESIRVRFVFDGDTIFLENGETVRYIGIDAPEIDHNTHEGEYMADAARNFNKKCLADTHAVLERDRDVRDRYGRLLGYIFLTTGPMVNELLVAKGLAVVSTQPPNTKYQSRLLRAQRQAMKARAGIWRRLPEKEQRRYVGNKRSYRFHTTHCPFGKRISKMNRIPLNSLQDAFWRGYSPCKTCQPAAILKK